jgi:predicted amidophosphoribosyltransferase
MNHELRTVAQMIALYCRDRHKTEAGLCPECSALLEYAGSRLAKCRFKPNKPTCAKCPVHCYAPRRREQIRQVMRYSGPRMLLRHPLSFLRHNVRSRRS